MGRRLAIWLLLLAVAGPAHAAVYVVQPFGDDAADGTFAPWRTIGRAVRALAPGDTLIVGTGIYTESVVLTTSGAPGLPIAIVAQAGTTLLSPDRTASLSGFDVASGVGHLVIDGFTLRGFDETIFLRSGAHDVEVRGCTAEDNTVGIWIAQAHDVTVSGCTLRRNRIGLRISGASTGVTVRDTVSADNDDGLACAGDADGFAVEETARDVRFERCTASRNGEDGFDLQGDAIALVDAISRDNGCSGVKLGQSASIANSVIAGNTTGVAVGSFFGAPVTSAIVNSVVADNQGTQILLRANATDPSLPSTVLLRNLLGRGDGKILEAEWPLTLIEDHNVFFRRDTSSAAIVRHLATGERRYTGQDINFGVWQVESGQGAGTLAVDPGFVDADYTVGADSPAVDRGMLDAAPTTDRAARIRPQGGAIDIGPDEFAMATGNHRPWADPGPDRTVDLGARLRVTGYGCADPDRDPLTYAWDFGDGGTATGANATHTFSALGMYVLTLTVSDGQLTHTRTAMITVREPVTATPTATPTSTPRPPTATAVPPTATAIRSATGLATPAATATRTIAATESPPSPTPTPAAAETATASPTRRSVHDSALRVPSGTVRLRTRPSQPTVQRSLVVAVRNADPVSEFDGHLIRLVVSPGSCPSDIVGAAPDFDKREQGEQAAMPVEGGRQRRARIELRVDTRQTPPPFRCALHIEAIGPGEDPTPGNNSADVPIEVR